MMRKKLASLALALVMCLSLTVSAFATTGTYLNETILQNEGTALLTGLLERQFNANRVGTLIDTSDILADAPGTELYKQYLYWYSGKCTAAEEYWTEYDYALNFDYIDGDTIVFTADLSYGRTCSKYNSEAYGLDYRIQLVEQDGKFYISDIDSDEINFYAFKNLISGGSGDGIALLSEDISAVSMNTLDTMIADYERLKANDAAAVIDPGDVVDMEKEHEAYLEAMTSGSVAEPASTSYSYDRERGRRYADLYYTKSGRNTCFVNLAGVGGDCTNWVSQCVWAAYGGWTDGDSEATMTSNIKARKRMQSSAVLDNWFGHKTGVGNPWGNVSNFWDFTTGSPSTGPKATGYNDGKKWSGNFVSTDFVTGQVLQVKNGSSGKYAHSVYVSGGTNDSISNIKITQHSPFNRIMLDEFIDGWGGSNSCYLRQLKFSSANFDR